MKREMLSQCYTTKWRYCPGQAGLVRSLSPNIFSAFLSGLVFTVISRQTLLCKGSTAIHRRMETRLFFQ
ncbi:hypothetical protein ACLB1M_33180 [Escherichia coli]